MEQENNPTPITLTDLYVNNITGGKGRNNITNVTFTGMTPNTNNPIAITMHPTPTGYKTLADLTPNTTTEWLT